MLEHQKCSSRSCDLEYFELSGRKHLQALQASGPTEWKGSFKMNLLGFHLLDSRVKKTGLNTLWSPCSTVFAFPKWPIHTFILLLNIWDLFEKRTIYLFLKYPMPLCEYELYVLLLRPRMRLSHFPPEKYLLIL